MNDPLFLRQPKGVAPTERARLLAAPIADILERARQVMANARRLSIRASSVRRFVIGAPDAVTAVLLPGVAGGAAPRGAGHRSRRAQPGRAVRGVVQ